MKKRYAAIAISAILLFSGCGKVERPAEPAEKKAAAAADGITTSDEDNIPPEETKTMEDTVTTDANDIDDAYIAEILGDGYFGFEMYNYGHIPQSWDNRIAGAKLLLEGMAQPGTEERELDLAVSVEQLNALETEGFMLNMKFEDNKAFRVGNTIIEGCGVTLIGYENSFIFCIEYFDENDEFRETPYYELEIDYIPLIVDAVQYGKVSEPIDDTQPVIDDTQPVIDDTQPVIDDGSTYDTSNDIVIDPDDEGFMLDEANGVVVYAVYQGDKALQTRNSGKILDITLEAMADQDTSYHTLDQMIDFAWQKECFEDGLFVEVLFADVSGDGYSGHSSQINIGGNIEECMVITICGKDGRYSIYPDDRNEMMLSEGYAERIIHEGLGLQ